MIPHQHQNHNHNQPQQKQHHSATHNHNHNHNQPPYRQTQQHSYQQHPHHHHHSHQHHSNHSKPLHQHHSSHHQPFHSYQSHQQSYAKPQMPQQPETTYYIDATNVCYWQNPNNPSLNVLLKLLITLRKDKKQSFYCIFDANTKHILPEYEKDIYYQLLEHKEFFHQVTGGKPADDYVLGLADRYNAPIISNDTYANPRYDKYRWLKRVFIPKRLFMGEVINTPQGNHLMLFDLDINETLYENSESLFKLLLKILYPPKPRHTGTIKFYHDRGWGRITFKEEREIYFHKSAVKFPDAPIFTGQEVMFMLGENERGECAIDIDLWLSGIVAHYDEYKELGNIKIDSSPKELFFFKSYFDDPNFYSLYRGQRVKFVAGENNKGECARHIRLVKDSSATIKILKDRIDHLEILLREKEEEINELSEIISQQEDILEEMESRLEEAGIDTTDIDTNIETSTQTTRHTHTPISSVPVPPPPPPPQDVSHNNLPENNYQPPIYNHRANRVDSPYQRPQSQPHSNGYEPKVPPPSPQSESSFKPTPPPPVQDKTEPVIKPVSAPVPKPTISNDSPRELNRQTPLPIMEQIQKIEEAGYFDTPEKRTWWWNTLDNQWKKVFNVVRGYGEVTRKLPDEDIEEIFNLQRLSFYRTSRHRLTFKLTNLSGVKYLTRLVTLNIADQEIEQLDHLELLTNLEQFNCYKNKITSLEQIGHLDKLEQLNCANNYLTIDTFIALAKQLPNLYKLDCRHNNLSPADKDTLRTLAIENIRA